MNHLIERVTGDDNETGSVNVGAVNVVLLVETVCIYS